MYARVHIAIGRVCLVSHEDRKDKDEDFYGKWTDLAVIRQLLDMQIVDVNKCCDEGNTPIHDAV